MILQAAISGAVELYWITKKGSYVFCPYWYNSDAQKQYINSIMQSNQQPPHWSSALKSIQLQSFLAKMEHYNINELLDSCRA